MKGLRLLAAVVLLWPSASTAHAASRVVEAPTGVRLQALPTLPSLPAISLPQAQLSAIPVAPVGIEKISAPAQLQAVAPNAQAPDGQAPVVFDGAQATKTQEFSAAPVIVADETAPRVPSGLSAHTPYTSRLFARLGPLDKRAPERLRKSVWSIRAAGAAGGVLFLISGLTVFTMGVFVGIVPVLLGAAASAVAVYGRMLFKSGGSGKSMKLPPEEREALRRRAQTLSDLLAARLEVDPRHWPLVSVDNSEGAHNAWASGKLDGSGRIGVGEDYAKRSDEELVGTLAHEFAHVKYGDDRSIWTGVEGAKAAASYFGVWAAGALIGGAWLSGLNTELVAGAVTGSLGALLGVGGAALIAKASRIMEHRADRFGTWLTKASWVVSEFRKQAASGTKADFWDRLLSTHPQARDRVRDARRFARTLVQPMSGPGKGKLPLGRRLALEDWTGRKRINVPGLLTIASIVTIGLAVLSGIYAFGFLQGLTGGAIGVVMGWQIWLSEQSTRQRDPSSSLEPWQRDLLLQRGKWAMSALLARVGLTDPRLLPRMTLDNGHGKSNAWVNGPVGNMEIGLGDDWAGRSDRQLAAVLAHELGHAVNGDHKGADLRELSAMARGQSSGSLLSAGLMLGGLSMGFWPEFGFGVSSVFAAIAAFGLPWVAHYFAMAASRARERRADAFAVWLTSGRWLAEFFMTLDGREGSLGDTHPDRARRVEDALSAAAKKTLGPKPGGFSPKDPGTQEETPLK